MILRKLVRPRRMPQPGKTPGRLGEGGVALTAWPKHYTRAEHSGCNCERQASAVKALIQALAHLLAGLEKGNRLFVHWNMRPGARIAANPCVPVFHREGAEPTQFDPVAARQGAGDFIENCIDDFFHIAKVEMRVTVGDPLYELGFDHRPIPQFFFVQNSQAARRASVGAANLPNRNKTVKHTLLRGIPGMIESVAQPTKPKEF